MVDRRELLLDRDGAWLLRGRFFHVLLSRALALALATMGCSTTGSPNDASIDVDASSMLDAPEETPPQDPRCTTASCSATCDEAGVVCHQRPPPCQSDIVLTCTPVDAGSDASTDASATWACTPCGV